MRIIAVDLLRAAVRERGISHSDVAREAGLSRTTVSKLLNGSAARVHARTVEKLARALGLVPDSLDRDHVATEYRQQVTANHGYLSQSGLGIVNTGRRIPIEHGFIPIKLRRKKRADSLDRWPRDADQIHAHSNGSAGVLDRPAQNCSINLALKTSRHCFVLGEPGAGKTTLLRYLAWCGCSRTGQRPSADPIPVFVRLSSWAVLLKDDDEVGPFPAAVNELRLSDPKETVEWLEQRANAGDVVFLLDGLDEVAEPDWQAALLEKLRDLIRHYPNAQVLITSRPVGFEDPNLGVVFDTYGLERLEIPAIKGYVERWCALRHGHAIKHKCTECDRTIERLRHAVVDNERIHALSHNPMMLTILLLLHDSGASLPQRRIQLYEKIVEAFLFVWEQKKREAVSGVPDRKLALDDRDVLWLLEAIALDMQQREWTLAPKWWLLEKSTSFLQEMLGHELNEARAMAEILLRSLEQRAGILVERGPEKFGFEHLAFQEYFAARAVLGEEDPIAALSPYLYHPRWREVVRLVAGSLDRRRAPQLLRVILDDPDPTGRFLRRGLLIALGCLVDGAAVYHDVLLDHIKSSIVELANSRWLGITFEVFRALRQLEGTRFDGFMRETANEFRESAIQIFEANQEVNSSLAKNSLLVSAVAATLASPNAEVMGPNEDDSDSKPITAAGTAAFDEPILLAVCPASYDAVWAEQVLDQLQNDPSDHIRKGAAEQLARFVRSEDSLPAAMLEVLTKEKTPSVRAAIALGLGSASRNEETARVLLTLLRKKNEDDEVRASCAMALGLAAADHPPIRDTLIECLNPSQPYKVRGRAARGLARCLEDHQASRNRVFDMLADVSLNEDARVDCLHALEMTLPSIPKGVPLVAGFLASGPDSRLARVGAQVLAEFAATGRVAWRELPIEQIERILVEIKDPCQCALDAIRSLVDAREIRKLGLSREKSIERALSQYRERIRCLFVFGSSAKSEQGPESDIDLMIIGNVTLKELTPALKRAETELGRQINAILYTQNEWEQRIAEQNPFVMRVLNAEKNFVIGQANDLGTVVR